MTDLPTSFADTDELEEFMTRPDEALIADLAAIDGDIIVLGIVSVLGLMLILLPWIPGLRDVPRRLGLYRVIWRSHYSSTERRPLVKSSA